MGVEVKRRSKNVLSERSQQSGPLSGPSITPPVFHGQPRQCPLLYPYEANFKWEKLPLLFVPPCALQFPYIPHTLLKP